MAWNLVDVVASELPSGSIGAGRNRVHSVALHGPHHQRQLDAHVCSLRNDVQLRHTEKSYFTESYPLNKRLQALYSTLQHSKDKPLYRRRKFRQNDSANGHAR